MNSRLSVYIFSVESLPTSSQLRVMNADEDHIFSADDFATPDDDPKDEDYHPPDSSELETDISSGEDSQKTEVTIQTIH